MIGNALRIDIEAYLGTIDGNVMFGATNAGRVTREIMLRYVGGLHYMLTLTPIHLVRARERAREMGDTVLADHFQHKLEEEVGHADWAENDLAALRGKADRCDVMDAARALGAHNERLIEENPALYLAYIAFAEYVTVMVGPKLLKGLEERCGIPQTSMTAVGNHVELDREHAEEGFSVMDDLVGDPKLLGPMREALASSIASYESFCAEAVGVLAESGEIPVARHAQHVSAA